MQTFILDVKVMLTLPSQKCRQDLVLFLYEHEKEQHFLWLVFVVLTKTLVFFSNFEQLQDSSLRCHSITLLRNIKREVLHVNILSYFLLDLNSSLISFFLNILVLLHVFMPMFTSFVSSLHYMLFALLKVSCAINKLRCYMILALFLSFSVCIVPTKCMHLECSF